MIICLQSLAHLAVAKGYDFRDDEEKKLDWQTTTQLGASGIYAERPLRAGTRSVGIWGDS
jgi:hypothetical protein